MTTIVHFLCTCRHYSLGFKLVVKTDNVATCYFQSQRKIILKQPRWQEFLEEFDYILEQKTLRGNVVTDDLSRNTNLDHITTAHCDTQDGIKDGMQHDPEAKKLMNLSYQG